MFFLSKKMTSWDDDWRLEMAILCPFCSTDDCRQYTFFLKINTFSEHIAAKLFFSEQYAARSVLGLRGYGAYRGDIQRLWANLPKTGENLEMSFIRQGVRMSLIGTSPAEVGSLRIW